MIDEESRKKVAEGLEILLSLQRRFQDEHGFDFWKEGLGKKREMFIKGTPEAMAHMKKMRDAKKEKKNHMKQVYKPGDPECLGTEDRFMKDGKVELP